MNKKRTSHGKKRNNHSDSRMTYEEWEQLYRKRSVRRDYKDTVFRMLFNDKKELLALYNAVNGTHYNNPDDLQITTLEGAIYMQMKNDMSFILELHLELYEHQSTVNPNLPLRYLFYIAKVFEELVIGKDLYARTLIRLPAPRFITFYNGVERQPERLIRKLSEAYSVSGETVNLELQVVQLNINDGFNEELKQNCPTLRQYMQYVDRVRENRKTMPLEQAVERSVEDCISEGILKEFLLKNKAKVVSMSIFEYDDEQHKKTVFEEGRAEGREEGRAEGREEGRAEGREEGRTEGSDRKLVSLVCRKLRKGCSAGEIADALEEDIREIERICRAAQMFAPEYDEQKVYERAFSVF